MAIFPRRQLQRMLNELGSKLKRPGDLLARLDNKDPDQVLPAEYELALGWAMSQIADVEVEPSVGGKSPDFLVEGFFPGLTSIIEVAALSDDALSGESSMERTANLIGNFADSVRKRASDHLHFHFLEKSGYDAVQPTGQIWGRSTYYRKRLTSKQFKLTEPHKSQLRTWLATWPPPAPMQLSGEGTEVIITWKDYVHPMTRVFSSMPSLSHSLTDNPVYRRLKEKERKQLKIAGPDFMRCIFLGDAGCRMLRVPAERDATRRVVSGEEAINYFLANSTVDLVAVFSPRRRYENSVDYRNNPRIWHVHCYDKVQRPVEFYDGLKKVAELLPSPRLHGYQARSWLRQDMLAPQGRGQYRSATYTSGRNRVSAKISARAILELMAGRMTADDFRLWALGEKNLFDHWLTLGFAISDVKFEASGSDHDDDYVIFQFEKDPNASPLELPSSMPPKDTD